MTINQYSSESKTEMPMKEKADRILFNIELMLSSPTQSVGTVEQIL